MKAKASIKVISITATNADRRTMREAAKFAGQLIGGIIGAGMAVIDPKGSAEKVNRAKGVKAR